MILPPVKELPPMGEIRTELLGIAASHPFVAYISSARQQMYTNSHMSQKIVVHGLSENFISTPMDIVLCKATMGIRMPKTSRILKRIPRYPDNNVGSTIAMNPETVVLYEEVNTNRLGMLSLTTHMSHHAYFGYDLIPTKDAALIAPDNVIQEDTILYDSPGRSPTNRYMSGVMLNTAIMGHRATAEDGLVISRDVLPALRFKRYERRVMEWGERTIPLNLYGDENNYKIMPEIGEYIRDDGVVMAKRDIDKRLSPVDLSKNGLRRVDYTNDTLLYAKGKGKGKGGKVIDIVVTVNYDYENKGLSDMNAQLEKYIEARKRFHKKLIEEYEGIARRRPDLKVTRPLHALIHSAMVDVGHNKQRFFKVFKKVAIDHIRVEFIIEYEVEPNIGYKLTETSGGKGIIVAIREPEDMPMDMYGRRAQILSAYEARSNRMNPGGLHEIFYNDALWHARRKLLSILGIPFFEGITLRDRTTVSYVREERARNLATARAVALQEMHRIDPVRIQAAWDFIITVYRLISPYQAHQFDQYDDTPWVMVYSNLANIVEDFIYLEAPPDYAPDYFAIATKVKEFIGFERGPVTFRGDSGEIETTEGKVRIAPMKWMLLEKTGDTWSAVDFAKVQQYGFLAQINNTDRHSTPGRPQPIKGAGETEFRIINSTCGQIASAELGDRNNNLRARKALHRSIMTHSTPGNIANAVDRNKIPYGNHRGVQILHHYLNCGGIALAYAQEEGT